MDQRADVGVVGLGVMGANIALNLADHGLAVCGYDRATEKARAFQDEHASGSRPGSVRACSDYGEFVKGLARPRKIIMLVPAGGPVDSVIDSLSPVLEEDDILIDGGNSDWRDTDRRAMALGKKGLRFVGCGVSGGEVGARYGPSLMPGGDEAARDHVLPMLQRIAAKVDPETGRELPHGPAAQGSERRVAPEGDPCVAWIGPGGAGHFVKMVHNGIEYADMQLICEAYHILRGVVGMEPKAIGDVFEAWNGTALESYLVEITADILRHTDAETGKPFVDVVLDAAGQKGTGKWTVSAALDFGTPAPAIGEAVFARFLSSLVEERHAASRVVEAPAVSPMNLTDQRLEGFIDSVSQALYCSKLCAYAQGFALIADGSHENDWGIDLAQLARTWRGGCIIRARLLSDVAQAFDASAETTPRNLLLHEPLAESISRSQQAWRAALARAIAQGVPVPAMAASLAYYDGYRSARLPAGLLQAQRDFFGSHTYERVDRPRGTHFHTEWTQAGRPERET